MKVVLCKPPFSPINNGPPLGLLFLGEQLRASGHDPIVYDINVELGKAFPGSWEFDRNSEIRMQHPVVEYAYSSLDDYCETILSMNPDVLGINLMYNSIKFGVILAQRLCKQVRCIAGGPECHFNPEKILEIGCFDAVVNGYGEEKIVTALTVDGLHFGYLNKNNVYKPDYSLISLDDYYGFLPVISSRGCVNHCRFCSHNLPYVPHDLDLVMEIIKNNPDAKQIMFNDSNLNTSLKRTEELFRKLAVAGNSIPIHIAGMQVKRGFEKYVPYMAEAGVKLVRLGIESGSLRERNSMRKPKFTNEMVIDFIKLLASYGITTWAQFIFCYPDQTEEDREKTLKLMHDINTHSYKYVRHYWYQFIVHHGTEEFFQRCYGLRIENPKTWENKLYSPTIINELNNKYKKLIPNNCELLIDDSS